VVKLYGLLPKRADLTEAGERAMPSSRSRITVTDPATEVPGHPSQTRVSKISFTGSTAAVASAALK
jgi:hypothetical protein